jgi:hypothetical protein
MILLIYILQSLQFIPDTVTLMTLSTLVSSLYCNTNLNSIGNICFTYNNKFFMSLNRLVYKCIQSAQYIVILFPQMPRGVDATPIRFPDHTA